MGPPGPVTGFPFFSWFYYKEICYDARSHEHKHKWNALDATVYT
jgi:hypothetical protein